MTEPEAEDAQGCGRRFPIQGEHDRAHPRRPAGTVPRCRPGRLTEDDMGNYQITIEGVGPHGNHLTHNGAPFDAEAHAARAVRDLIEDGHSVSHATVHASGRRIGLTLLDDGVGRWVSRDDGGPATAICDHKSDLAAHLYDVYTKSSGGKNYRGDPCPAWEALPEAIRGHWIAVAEAARR